MEGQHGWRAMGESIFPVAVQGHAVPGERLRICAHGSFFATSFSEFPSQVSFTWLFPPLPLAYLLTVSIPWGLCVRSLEMNSYGLQPPSKQLQQLEGPCCRWAGRARAGTLVVPHDPLEPTGGHGARVNPLPSTASFHRSVGCSVLQRDSTEELEAVTFQTLQMFAQGM